MRMKRALSLVLAVLMMASLLSVGVFAADQLTVITKSNGKRTLNVGDTFTYSFAIKLQQPYDIDNIEADILYDDDCLDLVDYTYPNFKGAVPDSALKTGDLHFKKGLITNHAEFSQSILAVVTCTFKVTRAGTTYIRPVIAQLEAEAGSNSDAYLVQNYRPVSARLAFWKTYDYLDENKPTSGSAALKANEDTVWFYVTDATSGERVPEGVQFVMEGADEGGTMRSYSAKTDEYGLVCFQKVRLGNYFVRCDSTELDGTTYLVNDPEVSVPNVSGGSLVIDTDLSVRSVSAEDLRDVTVTFTWSGEELAPGVTYQEDRPDTVYFALRTGETVLGQKYAANNAGSVVFERVPVSDNAGQPVALELTTGAIDQYDAVITKNGNAFNVDFRYKNDHTWESERNDPTCTENGSIIFTCSDCGATYTETLTALGHDYVHYGYDATCTRDGYHRYQCRRCDHIYVETEPKTGHNWGDWIVDKEVSPTEDGLRHRVCSYCGEVEQQIVASPLHEHNYKEVVVPPTCTEEGYTKMVCGCNVPGESEYIVEGSEVPALGHDYTGDSHTVNVFPASCTADGLEEWTCSRCGEIHAVPIPATGHNFQVTEQKEPTCTESGYKDMKCANCDEFRHQRLAPLGHDWGEWETVTPATTTAEGVKHRFCTRCNEEQFGTIPKLPHEHSYTRPEVIAPTCEEEGYTKLYCECGAFSIDSSSIVPALGHALVERWRQEPTAKTQGVVDHVCSRCGKHEFVILPIKGGSAPTPTVGGFTDVPVTAYFAEPVLWAVKHDPQITDGVTDTSFDPKGTCTRAQTVTFLWRAAKQPEPKLQASPFTDVQNPNAYYYKAVLWAYENNITDGTSATTFSPNATVTRGQVVTFLWRASDQPKPAGTSTQFGDVSPDAYYAVPVRWAVEQNITDGISPGKFGPNDGCTRAQIVTFLYRNEIR